MKKIITALVLVCLLVGCFASCNRWDYDKALEFIENGEYKAAYEIFESLRDYKDSKELLSRFHYVRVSRTCIQGDVPSMEYQYNSSNLPSQYIFSYSDGDGYTDSYEYDSNGNLIKHIDGNFNNEYIYDANGNLIKSVDIYNNDIQKITEYIYDENDILIKRIVTQTGDSCSHTYDYKYSYDANGNLIQMSYACIEEFYVDMSFVYDYTYDANGNKIKEVWSSYGRQHFFDYEYNAYGGLIREVETLPDGTQYIDDYTYDSNGNLIKKVDTSYNKDDYAHTNAIIEITDYTYDANGNLIEEIYTSPSGEQYTHEYIYDTNGNLIGEDQVNRFTKERRIANYTYDANGNKIKEIWTREDGSVLYELEYTCKFIYIPYDLSSMSDVTKNALNLFLVHPIEVDE